MLISQKIDQLIQGLENLKPLLTENHSANGAKFNEILASAMISPNDKKEIENSNRQVSFSEGTIKSTELMANTSKISAKTYSQKPNMRELMEKIAGRSVEDLYADPTSGWESIARQASELLYGVLGGNEDLRNWQSIMSSENIIEAARLETSKMHVPHVDIETVYNENNVLTDQIAVIKDKNNIVLRALTGNTQNIHKDLSNFGVEPKSIPSDLASMVTFREFNLNTLESIKKFQDGDNAEKKTRSVGVLDITTKSTHDALTFNEVNQT